MAEEMKGKSPTAGELRAWIGAWVERTVDQGEQAIDIHQTFVSLGLDSVHAMMLVGDLEEHLSRRLSPTLAWDYSTIETMATHLADATPRGAASGAKGPDMDILAHLDDLPEEELDRMIRERLDRKDVE